MLDNYVKYFLVPIIIFLGCFGHVGIFSLTGNFNLCYSLFDRIFIHGLQDYRQSLQKGGVAGVSLGRYVPIIDIMETFGNWGTCLLLSKIRQVF